MPGLNAHIEAELQNAVIKLRAIGEQFPKKKRQKLLKKAATPMVKAAKANIKDSKEPHKRYSTAKLTNKLRAPKGQGNVVAVYHPGNLRRSIRKKNLRRTADILVGPQTSKGSPKGDFKGRRVDGYYAHMVEFGTIKQPGQAYMRRALDSTKAIVAQNIIEGATKVINDYVKKEGIQ